METILFDSHGKIIKNTIDIMIRDGEIQIIQKQRHLQTDIYFDVILGKGKTFLEAINDFDKRREKK